MIATESTWPSGLAAKNDDLAAKLKEPNDRMRPNLAISAEETGVAFLTGLFHFLVADCYSFLTMKESVQLFSIGLPHLWK